MKIIRLTERNSLSGEHLPEGLVINCDNLIGVIGFF